jgi:hypothetical protein
MHRELVGALEQALARGTIEARPSNSRCAGSSVPSLVSQSAHSSARSRLRLTRAAAKLSMER